MGWRRLPRAVLPWVSLQATCRIEYQCSCPATLPWKCGSDWMSFAILPCRPVCRWVAAGSPRGAQHNVTYFRRLLAQHPNQMDSISPLTWLSRQPLAKLMEAPFTLPRGSLAPFYRGCEIANQLPPGFY